MRVGILGGGFMGEAFLRGLLRAQVASPQDIAVAEVSEARRTLLSEHGVRLTSDLESAAIGADATTAAPLSVSCGVVAAAAGPLDSSLAADGGCAWGGGGGGWR